MKIIYKIFKIDILISSKLCFKILFSPKSNLFLALTLSESFKEKMPTKSFIIANTDIKECILHSSFIVLFNVLLIIPHLFIIDDIWFFDEEFWDKISDDFLFWYIVISFLLFIDLFKHEYAASSIAAETSYWSV